MKACLWVLAMIWTVSLISIDSISARAEVADGAVDATLEDAQSIAENAASYENLAAQDSHISPLSLVVVKADVDLAEQAVTDLKWMLTLIPPNDPNYPQVVNFLQSAKSSAEAAEKIYLEAVEAYAANPTLPPMESPAPVVTTPVYPPGYDPDKDSHNPSAACNYIPIGCYPVVNPPVEFGE